MTSASKILMGGSGSGPAYEIDQSLIFDRASTTTLSRTPSSAGNRKTYTYSGWIKRASIGSSDGEAIFGTYDGSSQNDATWTTLMFGGTSGSYGDALAFNGWSTNYRTTNRVFRDISAWYHIVVAVDTTASTADNRVRIYVNGVEETSFGTKNNMAQHDNTAINNTQKHDIGAITTYSTKYYFSGDMAEVNFIDGTALTPSSFGETNSATGQWIPKEYSGSYGTNGFYLKFKEGEQSVFFGTNQRLYIGDSTAGDAAIDVGTGDYTYEFWFYNTGNANNYPYIIDSGASGNSGSVYIDVPNSSRLIFHGGVAGGPSNAVFATSTSLNTWYHVAISRSSGTTSCYLNGTRGAVVTDNGNYNNQTYFLAGGFIENNDYNFTGNISNLRIIKGSGIYNGSSITVPTAGLTNVTNTTFLGLQGLGHLGAATVTVGPPLTNYNGATVNARRPSSFTTLLGLGTDHSGLGNNYTGANLLNHDIVTDTPTDNFCTLNSINGGTTYAEGNLKGTSGSNSGRRFLGTMGVTSGKWYWECKPTGSFTAALGLGVTQTSYQTNGNSAIGTAAAPAWGWYSQNTNTGYSIVSSTWSTISPYFNPNDIIGVALDLDNSTITFYKNGSAANVVITIPSSGSFIPIFGDGSGSATITFEANFGQKTFAYTPPSNHVALSTANLAEPAISLPSEEFNTVVWTGNSTDNRVIPVGFAADLTWFKQRTGTNWHALLDTVRGNSNPNRLSSNVTNAAGDWTGIFKGHTSTGFTVGTDTAVNANSNTYVAWNWKAGGTAPVKTYVVKVVSDSGNKYRFDDFAASAQTVDLQEGGTYTFDQSDSSNSNHPLRFSTTSNGTHGGGSEYTTGVTTNGTPGSSGAYTKITVAASTATLYYYCTNHSNMGGQANTNSTFGSTNFEGGIKCTLSANPTAGFSIATYDGNNTIGHGLGKIPQLIICKPLRSYNWIVYYNVVDGSSDYMVLNTTAAGATGGGTYTSSVASAQVNGSCVQYHFVSIPGYSKMGIYRGNGSADGPFVNCGFKPGFVMTKKTGTGQASHWRLNDSVRSPSNVTDEMLQPSSTAAEVSGETNMDILSNGFKIKTNSTYANQDGQVFLCMAFAESPFKYASAR